MDKLKQLRLERGLSQQQLADFLHISQQSVYKYENDISQPNIDLLKNMADFFGTSVDYLIGYASAATTIETNLSPMESKHLYLYRQLTPEIKSAVDTLITELTYRNKH